MKLLFLTLILLSNMVGATEVCRDVSTTCLHESESFMSKQKGEKYCSNVATNCFSQHIHQDGFYGARDKCKNVSATCYGEVSELAGPDQAIRSCANVSTRCYQGLRSKGQSIKASIKRCFDVYAPCRTCFRGAGRA